MRNSAVSRRVILSAGLVATLALTTACANGNETERDAAAWPPNRIEFIVPSDPGSTPDLIVREFAQIFDEEYGSTTTVLGKPGAGGALGMRDVVNGNTDGSTIGISFSAALLWQPRVNDDTDYGADGEGYTALVKVTEVPSSLIVAADAPWNTLQEFAKDAKNRELTIGVTGKNAQSDLIAQLLTIEQGWKLNTVPFTDGGASGLLAVMRGEIDAQISTTGVAQAQIDAGELRVLSVFSDTAEPKNPDAVPSSQEGVEPPLPISFYFVAPEGIDPAVESEMREKLWAIISSDAWADALERLGFSRNIANYEDTQADLDRQRFAYDQLAQNLSD